MKELTLCNHIHKRSTKIRCKHNNAAASTSARAACTANLQLLGMPPKVVLGGYFGGFWSDQCTAYPDSLLLLRKDDLPTLPAKKHCERTHSRCSSSYEEAARY